MVARPTCRRRRHLWRPPVHRIAIKPATHAALKAIARQSRRTLRDLVDKLLRHALKHHA